MPATFFASQDDFRKWLKKHHDTEHELVVGFYKIGSGKPTMTWSQSVDQALCFGWIDSVRRSIDAESYCIRFTPRRPNSIWSAINIKKVQELTKSGLMTEDGIKAFELRTEDKSEIYAHEMEPVTLTPEFETRFKINPSAWEFFNKQTASYKKRILHWIMAAKQEQTQLSRLEKVIGQSKLHKRMV